MKVQVKGLVFVGFAAAVFAQSALAATGDNKIVTSKQYVDSKIVGTDTNNNNATTINSQSSDTDAPSMLNVYKFVTGQVSDAAVTVAGDGTYNTATFDTTNNTYTVTLQSSSFASTADFSASDTTNDGKLATAGAVKGLLDTQISGTEYDSTVPTSLAVQTYAEAKSNKLSGTNNSTITNNSTDSTMYPSAKAVYDFVTGGTHYQPKAPTDDTTSLYVGHNGSGNVAEWNKLEAVTTNAQASTDYVTLKWDSTNSVYDVNLDSGHIAATSALTGTTATNDTGLVTAGSIRSTILQAVESSISLNTTDDSTVPSTKNVYDFVAGYAQDNYQPKVGVAANYDSTFNSGAGRSKVMVGYTTRTGTSPDYTYTSDWQELKGLGYVLVQDDPENGPAVWIDDNQVASAGSGISSATSSSDVGSDLTTAWAVKEYVTGLLGGLSIPAPEGECANSALNSDSAGACALVMAWDSTAGTNGSGAVTLKWRKMAQ